MSSDIPPWQSKNRVENPCQVQDEKRGKGGKSGAIDKPGRNPGLTGNCVMLIKEQRIATVKPNKDMLEMVRMIIKQNDEILCINKTLIEHFSNPIVKVSIDREKKTNGR